MTTFTNFTHTNNCLNINIYIRRRRKRLVYGNNR